MPVREYTQALGVVLILIGLAGLVLEEQTPADLLSTIVLGNLAHVLTGSLLSYLGFGQTDEDLARTAVVAFGVVYLLIGVLGFVLPPLLGPLSYGVLDNIIHLLVAILSLAVYFGSRRGSASKA
jgi:hypothetical protein